MQCLLTPDRAPSTIVLVPQQRLDSLDVMRALAVVMMVMCHFPAYLSNLINNYTFLGFFCDHMLGDFAAALFLFLVGASQAVVFRRMDAGGRANSFRSGLFRGMALIALGILLEFATNGVGGIYDCDILPLIGVAVILLAAGRRLHSAFFMGFCVAAFVLAPWLREKMEFMDYWGDTYRPAPLISDIWPGFIVETAEEFSCAKTLGNLIKSFLATGYFPLIPWLLFPFAGFIAGKAVLAAESIRRVLLAALTGFMLGSAGVTGAWISRHVAAADAATSFIAPLSMYPASATMVLLQLGVCLLLFAGLRLMLDFKPGHGFLLNYCRLISRYALSIYVLHELVIFVPLALAGWAAGGKRDYYYQDAMSTQLAAMLAVGLLLILGWALPRLEKWTPKISLEWWFAKLT